MSGSGSGLKDSALVNLQENVDEPATLNVWAQVAPEDYTYIYHDVQALATGLEGGLMDQVGEVLAPGEEGWWSKREEVVGLLKDSFSTAANTLMAHLPYLSSRVINHLTKKGIDHLQPLLGVTTTYRLTDKQVPTRANFYVSDVVSSLETFVNSHGKTIPDPILHDWSLTVLRDVTYRYEEMVSDTLSNVHKTQVLLSKMVKKKQQTKGDDGAMSDIDKISLQLFLDVTKYGLLLKDKLHVDPSTFPPYALLLSRVSAGEKFKNLAS